MRKLLSALCGTLVLFGSGVAGAAGLGIEGDYVEARTADIYTGPCISNSEVFIYGNQAVLAWKINKGTYEGVDLRGLSVAAAVQGSTTFSEDQPERARSIVIVDEKADSRQRAALVSLARNLAGKRLENIVDVRAARISLKIDRHAAADGKATHSMPQAPRATFWAAGLAQITTRPLNDSDHFCGNEVVAYPPLSRGVDVTPAYTLGHQFKGTGLNTIWDDPNCRSSFVGRFTL